MGLLDGFSEFAKTPEGQGLLAATFGGLAGAQKGTPWNNLGRAGMSGVMGYGGALERDQQAAQIEQRKKFQDQQMAHTQMQIDAAKRQQAQDDAVREAAKSAFISPERATALSMGPMPDGSAVPEVKPGFNEEQYMRNLLAAGAPEKALAWRQANAKDDTPISVAQGTTLLDKRTFKPLFTAPAKSEKDDAKITQYEYAKQNGYKGTFEQFVTLGPTIMAAAQAPLRSAQIGNIEAENAYNLPPPRPAPKAKPGAPMRGQIVQGYKFKGGNPADQSNWEKQ